MAALLVKNEMRFWLCIEGPIFMIQPAQNNRIVLQVVSEK